LDGARQKSKAFIENLGPKMLERGGVKTRHFAVDPETKDMTFNFSTLAEKASRKRARNGRHGTPANRAGHHVLPLV